MWHNLANELRELWRASGAPCSAYRPDLHYMRGPGPKWHAKHAGFLAATPPSAKPSRPGLRDVAQHRA